MYDNNYLNDQYKKIDNLPNNIKDLISSDLDIMNKLGIDNEEDQNKFIFILNLIPQIIYKIYNRKFPDNIILAICKDIFKYKEDRPISSLFDLMKSVDYSLKRILPKNFRLKIAYPCNQNAIEPRDKYNLEKWVDITQRIYALTQDGYSESQVINWITHDWDKKEIMDYKNWLKFYEEKVPNKYPKLAQFGNESGLYIPDINQANNKLKAQIPQPSKMAPNLNISKLPGRPDENDLDMQIESQRSKIVNRLNAAEKLLASRIGRSFAGEDHSLLLKLLHDLKRAIQTANKSTVRSSLFEDYIYRTANYLMIQGKDNYANFFYKIAQDTGASLEPTPEMPTTAPMGISTEANPTIEALRAFFENLKVGLDDPNKLERKKKQIERKKKKSNKHDDLIVFAQTPEAIPEATPVPAPVPASVPAPVTTVPLEQKSMPDEVSIVVDETTPSEDNTDDVIEAALNHISINDVISRLEVMVGIYNKREISRQLAVLDMMMDKLGLASFFPGLGEAMAKALEGNQYIGSRLEGILTKLKGSAQAPEAMDWISQNKDEIANKETQSIKQKLIQDEIKENERKEQRKLKEQQPATVPAGEISPELQSPVEIEKAPAIKTR